MATTIHVTILDDHQSIIDGYLFRLSAYPNIKVLDTLSFGEELEPALDVHPPDVLLLDINVPASATNPNPYPILHIIPTLLDRYPRLNIIVISMYAERGLIRATLEAGVSGYILKDDRDVIQDLGNIITSVANGGIFLSKKAHALLLGQQDHYLSTRQLEVLSLSATYPDWTSTDLAKKMSVANSTVRNLLSGAYLRLGVHNRSAAISKAKRLGIISPDQEPLPE